MILTTIARSDRMASPTRVSPRQSLLWRLLFCFGIACHFLSNSISFAANADALQVSVTSGLAGYWKIGFPTLHRVTVSSSGNGSGDALKGLLEVHTFDGDGVPVIYRSKEWAFDCSGNQTSTVDLLAKHGRGNRPIRIVFVDDQKQTILEHTLADSERGTALPANQPWIVGLGTSQLALAQGTMKSAQGSFGELSVSEITDAKSLPKNELVYSGVDAVVFSSQNQELNRGITAQQATALTAWTKMGGQLVLCWGSSAQSLANIPELKDLIPGEVVSFSDDGEPGPIESLLGSQQQLQPLPCAVLNIKQGRVDVVTATGTRTKLPFIARWAVGFGSVVWLATEIDCPQMLAWETRPALIKYLLKDCWEKPESLANKSIYQSYDELVGQLNATLDTFPNLRLGNLGQLVLIAGLLALLIGPLDYFLVSKAWQKPRWTWWTLIISSIGIMAVASVLARTWKPELPSINSLEIIDVDDQTQQLHGRAYSHCYAGRRGVYDFATYHRPLQNLTADKDTNPTRNFPESKPRPNRIDWFGQPGKGLGGFDSNVTTQLGLPTYAVESSTSDSTDIQGMGFPAAGTKAFYSEWSDPFEFPASYNGLGTVSGKDDLLQGSFANPLSVDILEGVLYFAGRAYTIPSRIRPGERVPISTSIPKDITRRLQRRTFVAGEEQGSEWNPADTNNLERLAELLSFHRSAGASSYSSLSNRYLSNLECSDLLKLERAVIFAQVAEPVSTWNLRRNGSTVQPIGGKQLSIVRMVFTVENNSRSSTALRELSPNPNP